jgi:hypothetical protein
MYDGKEAYLVLSKKKLLVINEKGFLHKNWNVIKEIPYDKIDEIIVEASHRLSISDVKNKKSYFASLKEEAKQIEKRIEELTESISVKPIAGIV